MFETTGAQILFYKLISNQKNKNFSQYYSKMNKNIYFINNHKCEIRQSIQPYSNFSIPMINTH